MNEKKVPTFARIRCSSVEDAKAKCQLIKALVKSYVENSELKLSTHNSLYFHGIT